MKQTIYRLLGLVFVAGALALPQVSLGYYTTDQQAIKINDNTVLFVIEYSFSSRSQTIAMPIGSIRGNSTSTSDSPYANFALVEDEEEVYAGGQVSSVVLSNADVVDNEYQIGPGQSEKFTLVALVTLSDEEVAGNPDLSLQVSNLPFTRTTDDGRVFQDGLNVHELSHYVTPEVDM